MSVPSQAVMCAKDLQRLFTTAVQHNFLIMIRPNCSSRVLNNLAKGRKLGEVHAKREKVKLVHY